MKSRKTPVVARSVTGKASMKRVLHVFPNWPSLAAHLSSAVASGDFESLNKMANRYVTSDGVAHHCYVINKRDDICDFIAWQFTGFEKHGEFIHLSMDDRDYLDSFIASRLRKEVV